MATVVFAPDSFKSSIRAADAARALARGWAECRPNDEAIMKPMADGGEGTIDAFAESVGEAQRQPISVTGPDGLRRDAEWLLLPPSCEAPGGIGVVELASTSGIELLGSNLRPWDADTLGFGEAIGAALDYGVSQLVLGIGSSASTDGGVGMLSALGAQFMDQTGRPISPGARGLQDLTRLDLSALRPPPSGGVVVLTDVTNPLLGTRGAAAVFGGQKGFTQMEAALVEGGLRRLTQLLPGSAERPGAGAAGGTGFGLLTWGGSLVAGAPTVAELIGLPGALASASVVVTGEGSFDGQTYSGKAPEYVSTLANKANVVALLVAGRIDATPVRFGASVSLTELAGSAQLALTQPARWLQVAGRSLSKHAPIT